MGLVELHVFSKALGIKQIVLPTMTCTQEVVRMAVSIKLRCCGSEKAPHMSPGKVGLRFWDETFHLVFYTCDASSQISWVSGSPCSLFQCNLLNAELVIVVELDFRI